MRKIIYLLVILFTITSAMTILAEDTMTCKYLLEGKPQLPFVVVGRVIGGDGLPVKGADVSIDPLGSTEMLSPYESVSTDENGCFKFVGFGRKRAKLAKWFLYTTDNYTPPGITPIYPPFVNSLQKADSRYNGIPFVPGNQRVVDVGDVPVVFRYGSAKLDFGECSENKCSSAIQWESVEIAVVHCGSCDVVYKGGFSREELERFVYPHNVDLLYLLPAGNWKLEIYRRNEDHPALSSSCFELRPSETTQIAMRKHF
jgi:hypothetical protein